MTDTKLSRYYDDNRDRSLVSSDFWPQRDRLFDWFEDHMKRIEDDFFRNRFSLAPYNTSSLSVFNPERRRRLFESMFHNDDDLIPRIVENRDALEFHIPTGPGVGFKPEELEVNVRGRDVEVKARHEEKSEDGNSYALREMRRIVRVPDGVNVDRVAAEMRHNGKLIVTAPVTRPAIEDNKDYSYRSTIVPIKVNRVW